MKIRLLIALAISVSVLRSADADGCSVPMVVYARRAISSDPALSQSAIGFLRNSGPEGLSTALQEYDRSHDLRLLSVIDAVAGQRDAVYSRLYWYTDLQQAQAAAERQHKPILYLRMLGKLTDEYSCANSRFFRTVLYSNVGVSTYLREHYVLVWVSERPVPVVTIDYGDGRVLKRTLTGNSAHYIINSHGQVIDVLPGLYDPKTFVAILEQAAKIAAEPSLSPESAGQYLAETDAALRTEWLAEARQAAPELTAAIQNAEKASEARAAMRRAYAKSRVERPLLVKVSPQAIAAAQDKSLDDAGDATWEKLAVLHRADATLDAASIDLIRSQNPSAYQQPGQLQRTVENLQHAIAVDTVHNNYQLRRKALAWLREKPGHMNVEELNARVYAELFMTPRTDPWLGLVPEATYTALVGDGCAVGK